MKTCPVCSHKNTDGAIKCVNCKSLLDGSGGVEKTRLADPAEFTVETGDVIDGRYKVVRLLGEGGMGEVYLAVDLLMDEEECAIKLIHHALMRSPEARQRFRSEVSTSRRLHHSSIIKVYDMGHWEEQNQYYFTMEYLEGKTLAALIMKRQGTVPPFSLDEIGSIMESLLQCLSYAHGHTIHRDIKPDNIMVKGEFPGVKIKILDFGIARAMSASRFTRTAQGLGTPHYMAPEQMEDAHTIDHRADLYGVGMILYELLTGKRAMGRFKPLVQVIGPAYAPMDPVVDTALAPDPEDRYRDAAAMLTDVEKALVRIGSNLEEEKAQLEAPEDPALDPDPKTTAEPAAEPTPQPEPSTEGKKKNPGLIFAGVAALLLVAGFLYFSLRGGDKPDPTVEETPSPPHIEQPAVDPRTEQLARCEQHRNNKAWKQAETCYLTVLQEFPDEQKAQSGLDTIYQQITAAGSRAVEQGDLNTARKQLAQLQSFTGAKDSAKALQKQIADYEKQQKIAAQKAKEEKQKKEIAGQLTRCVELHNNNEFTKAYSCYTDVRQRDSNNQQARTGLEEIIRDVLAVGSRAVDKEDLNTARRQLALLESFAGAKNSAKALQKQIADYEKKQKIAAQKEKERLRKQREEEQRKAKIAELEQQIRAAEQAESWQEMLTLAQTLFALQPDNILAGDTFTLAREKIAEEKEKASLARLTIIPEPADARIRILNIGPHYEPGMQLKPGRYHIEVSANGYETKTQWIELGEKVERDLEIALSRNNMPVPGQPYTDPTTGMEFVHVKGGCFQMGQTAIEKQQLIEDAGQKKYDQYFADELPRHKVCVDGFWLGKYEVSVNQWRSFIRETGYRTDAERDEGNQGCYTFEENKWNWRDNRDWRSPGFNQSGNHPVTCISYNDTKKFINWLNRKSKRSYRLPTEAEWEYAARGGTTLIRYWGNKVDARACSYANAADQGHNWTNNFPCDDGYKYTAPVGSFYANNFGLYDMLGNVWEWCSDWYGDDFYKISPRNNPHGPSSGSIRVLRGGSWCNDPWYVRAALRNGFEPGSRIGILGFRLLFLEGSR